MLSASESLEVQAFSAQVAPPPRRGLGTGLRREGRLRVLDGPGDRDIFLRRAVADLAEVVVAPAVGRVARRGQPAGMLKAEGKIDPIIAARHEHPRRLARVYGAIAQVPLPIETPAKDVLIGVEPASRDPTREDPRIGMASVGAHRG